ncbi:MAG: hypothetical protein ABIO92_10120 [Chloroflexia bacterium]
MDKTYGEFEGTEFDPSADLDFDDEQDDLIAILSISALVAAVVGAILVILGRRRNPTPQERVEDVLSMAGKQGKKSMKSMKKAVEGAKLGDLLDDALSRANDARDDMDLGGTWDDLSKKARKATRDMHLGSMLEDATDKARKAAGRFDFDDTSKDVRKRVSGMASSVRDIDIDSKGVEGFLDSLKEKLADAIDSVRSDVAPKTADRLKDDIFPAAAGMAEAVARRVREDVMPAAHDVVDKAREDVIPAAFKRAGKMADEYEVMPRARQAASSTKEGALSLADIMRGLAMTIANKVVSDVLPGVKVFGEQAMHTAREDVLPKARDVASQTPDVLSDVLKGALNKVDDAMHAAQPVAADAFEFSRHRAHDVASGVRGAGSGVGGAVSSAGRGVTGAVGSAVGATASATKETTGILFWASMLGGLILLAFVPEKEKQKEIWNNIFQFLGEIKEMWTDLQGVAGDTNTAV